MRVLHVIGRMDRAGAETMVMNLYREIDRCRFQFDFVYFAADRCDYDDEIESLGGCIHRISTRNPIARFVYLYRLLRAGRWQIVHSHTMFSSALHLAAARLAGVRKRVAHSHNTQDANSASVLGRLYQRAGRALLNLMSTHRLACGVAAAAYLFPGRHDVELIPNAVDVERFAEASGAEVRTALGIGEGELVIVQVARFMPVKNHVRSISIADALRRAGVRFQLLLIGGGPEEAHIEGLLRQHSLEDCVRMLGLRADIPELMAAADVMLMPSFHEGFPVVLVEAQAAGLPSVVSSAVSREVDLGLGMVRFLDLDSPEAAWLEGIRLAATVAVPGAAERRKVLEAAGFSSAAGAKRLEQVYASA